MLIVGSDTETTGLKVGDHRFVELYASIWDLDSRKKLDEFHTLVNPERSIPADSTRVHGYTAADLAGAPTWNAVARQYLDFLKRGTHVVFHNAEFDMGFIDYEAKRVGIKPPKLNVFDTFLNGRFATPYGKAPNLGELCQACAVDYDPAKAHKADYDVDRMMECFFNAVEWGFFKLGEAHAA